MTYLLFCVFLVVIDVTINHASLYMCFHCKNHCNLLNPGLTGVACQIHRRPEGGGNLGQLPPPWNLKMMTSYALSVQNTLKFSHHGRPQKFFQRGQNHGHFKKSTSFWRAVQKIDYFSARRRRKRKFMRYFATF